jgi:hypothetical protein
MTNKVPTMRKDAKQLAKYVVDQATREQFAARLDEHRRVLAGGQADEPLSRAIHHLEKTIEALQEPPTCVPGGGDTAE